MRKNLLVVLGLGVAFGASAQNGIKNHLKFENKPATSVQNFGEYYNFSKTKNTAPFTAKAGGDVIWSEDFSDINASGWTIDNETQTAPNIGWATVTSSRTWASGNGISKTINSTSQGEFLEVMNGTYNNGNPTSATNVTFTATSPAITIPNPNVTVRFLQYGALFNDSQTMEVSPDGNTWIEVFTNNDRTSFLGNNPAAIYANPEVAEANIGLVGLDPTTTSIQVRFKFTSRFAANPASIAWLTFGWMIDDLEVIENYSDDLKNTAAFVSSAGIRYSIVPESQAHQVAAVNTVLNNGSNPLSDVNSYAHIVTPTSDYIDTVAGVSPLAAYAGDTIIHAIDLVDLGTYSVSDFGSFFNGTDEDATNNTSNYSHSLDFGGTIYALDLGGTPTGYDSDNENLEFHVGNAFDIYSDVKIYGVDVYLHSSGNVKSREGSEIFASIRNYDNDMTELNRTDYFPVYAGDHNKWLTLVFEQPTDLYNNTTYVATVGTEGSGDPQGYDIVVGFSGESLRGSSLAFYGSSGTTNWYIAGAGGTPMVRMNLTPGIVSTANLEESVKANIYPNPANDKVVVDYKTAFAGDVTISVIDLSGRTVFTNTFANQEGNNKTELNVSDFNTGVYQVVIQANSSTITKKLVIK